MTRNKKYILNNFLFIIYVKTNFSHYQHSHVKPSEILMYVYLINRRRGRNIWRILSNIAKDTMSWKSQLTLRICKRKIASI